MASDIIFGITDFIYEVIIEIQTRGNDFKADVVELCDIVEICKKFGWLSLVRHG